MIDTIINGDCLEVMHDIPDGSVDMILCDLPYGTTACKWDTVIPFEPLWAHYKRVIKKNGAVVLFGSQPFTSLLVVSNLKWFKYCWVWDKVRVTGHLSAKHNPLKNHEDVAIFSNTKADYNPQMERGKPHRRGQNGRRKEKSGVYGILADSKANYLSSEYYPKTILKFCGVPNSTHPTQKPVPLFEYLIRTYTNPANLVLDNCSGSGTTAIACLNSNRRYICIEQDETYYSASLERVTKHKRQPKLIY